MLQAFGNTYIGCERQVRQASLQSSPLRRFHRILRSLGLNSTEIPRGYKVLNSRIQSCPAKRHYNMKKRRHKPLCKTAHFADGDILSDRSRCPIQLGNVFHSSGHQCRSQSTRDCSSKTHDHHRAGAASLYSSNESR
jgi:hypothetical protein